MRAYPDSKCAWGYICLCSNCASKIQGPHVDLNNPLWDPPAVNRKNRCEGCDKYFILRSARESEIIGQIRKSLAHVMTDLEPNSSVSRSTLMQLVVIDNLIRNLEPEDFTT